MSVSEAHSRGRTHVFDGFVPIVILVATAIVSTNALASASHVERDLRSGVDAAKAGNYSEAVKDFRLVAQNGTKAEKRDAEFNLGRLYYEGHGVEASTDKAIAHFKASANLGYGPAMQVLAAYYSSNKPGEPEWNKALLNMGTAEVIGLKTPIPMALRKKILSHYKPERSDKTFKLKYHARRDAKIAGAVNRGDIIYVAETKKPDWAIVYDCHGSKKAIGFARKKVISAD